ncbi:MAG: S66 family peptidase [Candidatus Micrarchaeia archaeon]
MISNKLAKGDKVAVVAPANSLSVIKESIIATAKRRLAELGLEVVISEHAYEIDDFKSSRIESRIEDLHWAFSDKSIKGILAAIGGFNSNQLLSYIDYDMIAKNPKPFCGYSDITALGNSLLAKSGLVTYSGPSFSIFGMEKGLDYTLEYFKKCLMESKPYEIVASNEWSDDKWYRDQENRIFIRNEGYKVIHEGVAKGMVIGGNLNTFNLLQGTGYMPNLSNSILFIEDDYESNPATFDRDLQSLIHQPGFDGVKGVVIGRFQKASEMSFSMLSKIINAKKELKDTPVICDVDFGHTTPQATFPIGGIANITADKSGAKIKIIQH